MCVTVLKCDGPAAHINLYTCHLTI